MIFSATINNSSTGHPHTSFQYTCSPRFLRTLLKPRPRT